MSHLFILHGHKMISAWLGVLYIVPLLASVMATQPLGVSPERDWLRRGYVQYEHGEYGDAEVSFRRALAGNPHFAEANFNLAQALYQQSRYAEALKYYAQARQDLPVEHQASLAHMQGNTLLKLNRLSDAASAYRQALRLRPGHVSSQQNLSYVLAKLTEQKRKKDMIRNVNQRQQKLNKNAEQNAKEKSSDSSDQTSDKNAEQASSQSKSNIESPQDQLSASDMDQMLKQLDQAEKQIRGRNSNAKAEKKGKVEAKDW